MPYCSRCGVEVDEDTDYCPLCQAPIQKLDDSGDPRLPAYPRDDTERPEDRRERSRMRRMLALQIVTTVLATPLVVVLVTDVLFARHLSWSSYVIASILAVWCYTATPLLWPRRPAVIILASTVVTALYLAALDLLTGELQWFVPLGLPIMAAVFLVALLIWLLARRARELGANLAGFILMGLAVMAIVTEVLIEAYRPGGIFLDWSLIVAVSTSPVAVFLFSYHYVLRRRLNLGRRFHL